MEVLHAEPERFSVEEKSIALDVRVRLTSGEQVDVEMQSQRRPSLRERALYYWARLHSGQLQRGESYVELRRSVVIFIADFTELQSARFHSIFRVAERTSGEILTNHFELHMLQLPQLSEAELENDEPALMAWGKFLMADDTALEQLAMESPVLKQARDALEKLSADPAARVRAEMREMALLSYELDLTKVRQEGKAEGRAEGKAEGRAEGKAELVRSMLVLRFGELPETLEERIAGAADVELQLWAERLLTASSLADVFA